MKKAIILSALLAGSTALGAGLVAIAQDRTAPEHKRPMMGHHGGGGHHGMMRGDLDAIDTNKDGNISKEEVQAAKAAAFAEIDTNQDGEISQTEMAAHREAKREEMRLKMETERFSKMKEKLDTNKDGRITQDEFVSDDMPLFDHLDTDNDGIVTAAERSAMKERMGMKGDKIRKWKEHRARNGQNE